MRNDVEWHIEKHLVGLQTCDIKRASFASVLSSSLWIYGTHLYLSFIRTVEEELKAAL